MSRHMDRIVRDAVEAGLFGSATAQSLHQPAAGERHWSVVAFTALAAWLSAVPLLAVIVLVFFKNSNTHGLVVGIPAVLASVFILRNKAMPLFAEQLAIPCLVAGAFAIAFEVYDDARSTVTSLTALTLIACAVAASMRKPWLQTLMGTAIGLLAGATLLAAAQGAMRWSPCVAWQLVAFGWLMLHVVSRTLTVEARTARVVAGVEAVSSGIAVACLLGLMWSGQSFLVDAVFMDGFRGREREVIDVPFVRLLSVMLMVGSGGFLVVSVSVLQTRAFAALISLCALMTWFAPALGVALLILFLCAENGRYVLAAFAGVAAAWLIGGLYYDLQWPLAYKALLLGGTGAAVALIGRHAVIEPALPATAYATPAAKPERMERRTRVGFLSCALLVLAVVNVAIWQKESVISTGTPVFVALSPVDPRSLMEGDYMGLRFALPTAAPENAGPNPSRLQVVARVDGRGIAELLRFHDARPLGRGEFVVDLVFKHNLWTFVTDAWYFKEGEAARWSKARYGEFRIAPDGRALLVGLRGAGLEQL